MISISLDNAPDQLPELLEKLRRGEDVVVLGQQQAIARVKPTGAFEAPTADEDLAAFIRRRRAALGMAPSPPAVPDNFDWPTHEDDCVDRGPSGPQTAAAASERA